MKLLRALFVWSSLSPVFLLWAIRGSKSYDGAWWTLGCLVLFVAPNIFLAFLIRRARRRRTTQTIYIRSFADRREQLITYLLALLIPLYDANIGDGREVAAAVVALIIVGFLFWYMELHYINVVFAVLGYRLFEIAVENGETAPNVDLRFALVSRRAAPTVDTPVVVLRVGEAVFLDESI